MTEDQKTKIEGFDSPMRVLALENRQMFLAVAERMFRSSPDDIVRYDYNVGDVRWSVFETPVWKTVTNERRDYNYFFSKTDGLAVRFGSHAAEDPVYCPLGPEIADIEIVAGKCPKINGRNCAFCYKNNGGETADCMTLAQFKEMVDFMPRNLSQIAFGITGVRTNPEFFDMMAYAKERGIVPNYTTNGVDLGDIEIEKTLGLCGRVAVSCYEGAKSVCYDTLRRIGAAAEKRQRKFPCNIHLVLSKQTMKHVEDVLNDAAAKAIPNLGAIVLLRMKPVGRAAGLDCELPIEYYERIVKFCFDNDIRFGFDSCGAKPVEKVLVNMDKADLTDLIEPCESSRFSAYFNWKREYWNCSFCENNKNVMNAVNMLRFGSFQDFWNSEEVKNVRFPKTRACESCPWYNLD